MILTFTAPDYSPLFVLSSAGIAQLSIALAVDESTKDHYSETGSSDDTDKWTAMGDIHESYAIGEKAIQKLSSFSLASYGD